MNLSNWSKDLKRGSFRVVGKWCAIAWTSRGVTALTLPQKSRDIAIRKLQTYLPPLPKGFWEKPPAIVPLDLIRSVHGSLMGKIFQVPELDLSILTPFQQRILQATMRIPRGQFRSYGWVAGQAGSPRGFRAAGQAMRRNPIPLLIPCHRIVAGRNRLGGYSGGIDWKISLLRQEGVRVQGGVVS